jgi:hypothetical protein
MVVFEVRFGQVSMQVRRAGMMELPVHRALKQRKECFGRVRRGAVAHIFVSRMVHSAVAEKRWDLRLACVTRILRNVFELRQLRAANAPDLRAQQA